MMSSGSSNIYREENAPQRDGLRRGKWTPEEEMYATRLIEEFKRGVLPLKEGTKLRSYLGSKLNCDPMRISKKFVGANSIGKQPYRRDSAAIRKLTEEEKERNRTELKELELAFLERVEEAAEASRKSQIPCFEYVPEERKPVASFQAPNNTRNHATPNQRFAMLMSAAEKIPQLFAGAQQQQMNTNNAAIADINSGANTIQQQTGNSQASQHGGVSISSLFGSSSELLRPQASSSSVANSSINGQTSESTLDFIDLQRLRSLGSFLNQTSLGTSMQQPQGQKNAQFQQQIPNSTASSNGHPQQQQVQLQLQNLISSLHAQNEIAPNQQQFQTQVATPGYLSQANLANLVQQQQQCNQTIPPIASSSHVHSNLADFLQRQGHASTTTSNNALNQFLHSLSSRQTSTAPSRKEEESSPSSSTVAVQKPHARRFSIGNTDSTSNDCKRKSPPMLITTDDNGRDYSGYTAQSSSSDSQQSLPQAKDHRQHSSIVESSDSTKSVNRFGQRSSNRQDEEIATTQRSDANAMMDRGLHPGRKQQQNVTHWNCSDTDSPEQNENLSEEQAVALLQFARLQEQRHSAFSPSATSLAIAQAKVAAMLRRRNAERELQQQQQPQQKVTRVI